MGFKLVKEKVIAALLQGSYEHEVRMDIDEKNKLQNGEVTAQFVIDLIRKSTGNDYSSSPHHQDSRVQVHVIEKNQWYVKFYFIDPATVFISVHQ